MWAYGTKDNPVELTTWGEGAAPTIGGKSLSERFAAYAAQGWTIESTPAEPGTPGGTDTPGTPGTPGGTDTPGTPGTDNPPAPSKPVVRIVSGSSGTQDGLHTVEAGKRVSFVAEKLKAGQEVTFTVYSEPQRIGTATADSTGVARIDWQVPADFERGRHRVVATGDFAEASLHFLVKDPAGSPGTIPDKDKDKGSTDTIKGKDTAGSKKTSSSTSNLASTGSTALPVVGGALLLALLGGIATITRRNRAKE